MYIHSYRGGRDACGDRHVRGTNCCTWTLRAAWRAIRPHSATALLAPRLRARVDVVSWSVRGCRRSSQDLSEGGPMSIAPFEQTPFGAGEFRIARAMRPGSLASLLLGLGLMIGLHLATPTADAQSPTVLRIADSFPGNYFIPEYYLKPWMEEVGRASGGTIRFQYFPSEQLGKAKDMLDLTASGVTDIGGVIAAQASAQDAPRGRRGVAGAVQLELRRRSRLHQAGTWRTPASRVRPRRRHSPVQRGISAVPDPDGKEEIFESQGPPGTQAAGAWRRSGPRSQEAERGPRQDGGSRRIRVALPGHARRAHLSLCFHAGVPARTPGALLQHR